MPDAFYNLQGIDVYLPDRIKEYAWSEETGKIHFSDSMIMPDIGYSPIFRGIEWVYANRNPVLRMPKTRFSMRSESFYGATLWCLVIPDISDFYSDPKAFTNNRHFTTVISFASVPPIIGERYGDYIYCKFLDEEEKKNNPYPLDQTEFPGVGLLESYEGMTLYVPLGTEELYANAPVWREFPTIIGVSDIEQFTDMAEFLGAIPDLSGFDTAEVAEPDCEVLPEGIAVKTNRSVNVMVSDISGRTVYNRVVDKSFDLSLENGVYVVSLDGKSTKVVIK